MTPFSQTKACAWEAAVVAYPTTWPASLMP